MRIEQEVKVFKSLISREGIFYPNEYYIIKEKIIKPHCSEIDIYSIYKNTKSSSSEHIGYIYDLDTAINIAKLLNEDLKRGEV